jgi:hypothetical protein
MERITRFLSIHSGYVCYYAINADSVTTKTSMKLLKTFCTNKEKLRWATAGHFKFLKIMTLPLPSVGIEKGKCFPYTITRSHEMEYISLTYWHSCRLHIYKCIYKLVITAVQVYIQTCNNCCHRLTGSVS